MKAVIKKVATEVRNYLIQWKDLPNSQKDPGGGICFTSFRLMTDGKISQDDYYDFKVFLFEEAEKRIIFYRWDGGTTTENNQFWFPFGDVDARIKYLDNLIKTL